MPLPEIQSFSDNFSANVMWVVYDEKKSAASLNKVCEARTCCARLQVPTTRTAKANNWW